MKVFLFFLLLIGCTLHKKQNLNQDYNKLVTQQFYAHKEVDDAFNKLFYEFQLIKPHLSKIIAKFFEQNEVLKIQNAFNNLNLEKKRKLIDHGSPVFHRFHGNWNGIWSQFNTQTNYDHTWYKPIKKDNLIIQKVIIGTWDKIKQKRVNEIAAINTYNLNTGLILGGVDLDHDTNKTKAPHLGFYVDKNTLIWLAKFNNKETSYYSLYFENIKDQKLKQYKIKGIGFYWDSKQNRIIQPHIKSGLYNQLL